MARYSDFATKMTGKRFMNIMRSPGIGFGPRGMTQMGRAFTGLGIMAGGIGMGAGMIAAVAEMGRGIRQKPVMHETYAPRPGLANKYYSLGDLPTSGVRFAGRYKRRF